MTMLCDQLSLHSRHIMYWPLGAPRVYAASRRKRKTATPDSNEKEDDEDKTSINILGLRVARHGHLFVTITDTELTVWQTSVSTRTLALTVLTDQ